MVSVTNKLKLLSKMTGISVTELKCCFCKHWEHKLVLKEDEPFCNLKNDYINKFDLGDKWGRFVCEDIDLFYPICKWAWVVKVN